MDAVDLNTYQLYMKLMSGDANAGQASFFQPPPPPQAPMLRLGGDRWAVDPAGSSYVAAAHGPVDLPMQGGNDFVYGLVPGAGNGTLAPGEGSLTIGGDVFVGNDQFVHGLSRGVEDPLLRMSDADLSAFMRDEAAVNSLCMPPEYLMSSLAAYQTAMADSPPVPPAAGPSQSSSDSPSLGAQARATDSPVDGAYPPVDYPQAASVDAPQQVPDNEMNGDNLSAFMSAEPAVNSLCMPPEYLMSLLAAYQPLVPPAAGLSQSSSDSPGMDAQVRATDSPAPTSQMGAYPTVLDYPPAASVDAPQQVPDKEMAEVADMVHVAARCSDKPSTAWSESEHQLLLQGLSRFADQDKINKCFNIASGLAEKTVLDVAYRIRWLSDLEKKEAAKQAQLGQEKSAGGNVTKGKGTKVANKKNNKHPLSKEALDSRSAKDIIRDNNRLMDKIEEILRSGQVKNSPDYFYYVKMNMDAMQNKVRDLASVMEGLLVGDEEWEDVLKDRDAPQAGHEAATPAP